MRFKTFVLFWFFSHLFFPFSSCLLFPPLPVAPPVSLSYTHTPRWWGDYTALTYSLSSIQSCQLAACPSSARPGREIAAIRQRGVLAELNFSTQASAEKNKPRAAFYPPPSTLNLKNAVSLSSCNFVNGAWSSHRIQDSCLWVKNFTRISLTVAKCLHG